MLSIGEINIHVSDFERAVAFWADGLGLTVAEREEWPGNAHARLDFEDGSPSIRLIWPAAAWIGGERPLYGARPQISFDVATDRFEETLARVAEHGGEIVGEIQQFENQRTAQIADPDGNVFELVEIPRAKPKRR